MTPTFNYLSKLSASFGWFDQIWRLLLLTTSNRHWWVHHSNVVSFRICTRFYACPIYLHHANVFLPVLVIYKFRGVLIKSEKKNVLLTSNRHSRGHNSNVKTASGQTSELYETLCLSHFCKYDEDVIKNANAKFNIFPLKNPLDISVAMATDVGNLLEMHLSSKPGNLCDQW